MTDHNREEVAKMLDELGVTVVYADDPVDGSLIEVVHLSDLVKIRHVFEQAHTARDAEEPEWEYGTRKSVTDGWERGDRYGEHEYIDARSVSDRINDDRSSTRPGRDMTRAVRRRKAGPWLPVAQGDGS